ncbi:N-acetylmuramoyl-L-alanine amidase [Thermoanaerobacterium sp. CMT5567-10]|uniref:N-acetylmuramoyl-L-alanine amidase family protein n=1 Tax=Thermoanaerobacterium sp. CMT5567-10 TaxID=3061989 RepID=UPI0026DFDF98|nr:N-acetylmuramoyl-L-alanine amidase [Thermoanaerobacterium sp. CMT5567-10]WKV07866.1 N-acetylmuramoyl-L-alanine amidase [Thermoanaerobacterium sp. CMT5567-10]
MMIVVDPGHGGSDSGAVGYGYFEKDINLSVSLKLRDVFKANNVDIILTRDKDVTLGLSERCDIANKNKADYFISIHCNSFKDSSAKGTETYSYPRSISGAKLAKGVQQTIVANLKTIDRGIKTANFYVLHHTNMPAILVELGFITNKEDLDLILNKQNLFAISISNGILNNIGLKQINKSDSIEKLHQMGFISDYYDPESYVKWKDIADALLKIIGG